jgi:[protein-PII] uridylyltransferase
MAIFRRGAAKSKITIPARTARESGIDGEALRLQLTEIAQTQNGERGLVLACLREHLDTAKAMAVEKFEHGRLSGLEMARLLCALHEEILTALYDYTVYHVVRAPNPTKAERMAICAVGGFGRGEMAPFSDLDLLFLLSDKKGSAFTESATEFILYMLWDLGLKVGHSTRTSEQCLILAKEDQTILTSLLDLRYLAGDNDLAGELFTKFRKSVQGSKGRKYIADKLAERDLRHEREGNSRYVIEPNIKEGKGGLRDLHALYWIASYIDTERGLKDPQRTVEYVSMGLFDEKAATRMARAADFLWRARIHLHLTAGRATEALSFDRQTVLARKMGHAGGNIEDAVEKFMREYFTNAREVGALTRIACAKLEADNAIRLPAGLDRFLPRSRRKLKDERFFLDHGRLNFADDMQIREDPSLIMELFLLAGQRNLDIHPDALGAIDFRRNLIDTEFRRNPHISKIFQDILLTAKAPYATLKVMNDAGVLGRYLLEFGGIVARTQFNMHHAYTVDEHTLRLVNYFHDLLSGELQAENPLATKLAQAFSESQRRIVYMACLLHDTGKGKGDQCVEGAQLGRRATRRLGLAQEEVDTVAWLIRRHLDLSETAQRRDISDPETIAVFGRLMGSQSRLNLLYVLTVVDIRAVGPGIWNDWKGVLLRELHGATAQFLEGKENLEPAAKALAAREQLAERLPLTHAARISGVLDELGTSYWLNFAMAALVRHARFFDDMVEAGEDNAVQTRRDRPRDITELWVTTRDRPGLFADLTKAISATGATIVGARLHTGGTPEPEGAGETLHETPVKAARVMNVFYLQNTEGHAFGRKNDSALATLRRRARQAALGKTRQLTISPARASQRAGAIPVRASVKFPDIKRPGVTLIEVVGRDRPGLLFDLANCLHDLGLDLLSAHIEVVGEKAIDAFYVKGELREKEAQKPVHKALRAVLEAGAAKKAA